MSLYAAMPIPGAGSAIDIYQDSAWTGLTGARDLAFAGGDAPTQDVVTQVAAGKVVGLPRRSSGTLQVDNYLPHLPVWQTFWSDTERGKPIRLRVTTKSIEIYESSEGDASAKAQIVAGALDVVQLTGFTYAQAILDDRFAIGVRIKIYTASDKSTSQSRTLIGTKAVSSKSHFQIDPDGVAMASANDYELMVPSLRRGPIIGQVTTSPDVWELSAEGSLRITIQLDLLVGIPNWAIQE